MNPSIVFHIVFEGAAGDNSQGVYIKTPFIVPLKVLVIYHFLVKDVAAGMLSGSRAADNTAGTHVEGAAIFDIHTAAVICRTAGNHAALDDLDIFSRCTFRRKRPLICGFIKFVFRIGVAVDERQTAAVCDSDGRAGSRHFQHMTVEVEDNGSVDGEGVADVDIR